LVAVGTGAAQGKEVAALIEQGRMHPPGQAEIDRAKADGRWEAAYDGAKASTVPDDLMAALTADPAAAAFFESLDRQNRYAILYRIQDAKKAETRARRIEKYVAMLAKGEKLHPWSPRGTVAVCCPGLPGAPAAPGSSHRPPPAARNGTSGP
jgi:uncharacterized protein YdeI (YjbR/CyaY-like superfamily)